MRHSPASTWDSFATSSAMEQRQIRNEMEQEDEMEAAESAAGFSNAIVLAPTPSMSPAPEEEASDEKQFKDLIKDFQSEPADDAAAAAKFKLYEAFAETVAASRKDTLTFWRSCKEDFEGTGGGAAALAVQRQVNDIDRNENLSINFDALEWFVCTMTKRANSNQKLIQAVLRSIETKLELLSSDAECPICLEPIEDAEVTVLGCCHRVCSECWTHWKSMRGGQAFCPLCRYSDFISEISTISGVTPADNPAPPPPPAAPAPAPAAGGGGGDFNFGDPVPPPAQVPVGAGLGFGAPVPTPVPVPTPAPLFPGDGLFGAPASGAWDSVEIGSDVTAMVAMVQAAHPDMRVLAMPEGAIMTMDFNFSRVRIFHDEDMKVTRKPKPG